MTGDESLRASIAEEVALRAHDPAWAQFFQEERPRLESSFPGAFLSMEHIGSTAIPGMPAKPIVDILAGVGSMEAADALVELLCRSSYATSAEFNAGLVDRRWLMRHAEGRRTHHLHIVVMGGQAWHDRLAFRDALLDDRALAVQYEMLKRRLASERRSDREAYTDGKSEFVRTAIARFRSGSAAEPRDPRIDAPT